MHPRHLGRYIFSRPLRNNILSVNSKYLCSNSIVMSSLDTQGGIGLSQVSKALISTPPPPLSGFLSNHMNWRAICSFPFSCSICQMLASFLGPHLTRRTYYNRIHSCLFVCLFVSIKAAMDLRCVYFMLSKPTSGKSSINLFWAEREGHKSVFLLIQSHQTVHWRTPLTEGTTNHVAHICTKNIFFWREDLIGVSAIILPKGSPARGVRVGLCKLVTGRHQKITQDWTIGNRFK